jgi:hypothetical protein
MRSVMEPNTAIKLRERKNNRLRDYLEWLSQAIVKFIRSEFQYIEQRMSESLMTWEEIIEDKMLKSWWFARLEGVLMLELLIYKNVKT